MDNAPFLGAIDPTPYEIEDLDVDAVRTALEGEPVIALYYLNKTKDLFCGVYVKDDTTDKQLKKMKKAVIAAFATAQREYQEKSHG